MKLKKIVKDKGLEPIVVGNGKKIVQQLPQANAEIMQGQKVILMTDGDMTAPDMVTWSKDDALKVSEITGIPFEFSGKGYVKSQSVSAGSVINSETKMKITLAPPEEISAFNQNHDQDTAEKNKKATDIQENAGIGDLLN